MSTARVYRNAVKKGASPSKVLAYGSTKLLDVYGATYRRCRIPHVWPKVPESGDLSTDQEAIAGDIQVIGSELERILVEAK